MPMSTILSSLMGYFARFAKVAPQNRRMASSPKPMDGCHSHDITERFALRSSANVWPYLKTNQSNISRKTALGSSILFCSYACLNATGIRSRNALMSAAFMLTTLLRFFSAIPWVHFLVARLFELMEPA